MARRRDFERRLRRLERRLLDDGPRNPDEANLVKEGRELSQKRRAPLPARRKAGPRQRRAET
jgi:hypothetical protein